MISVVGCAWARAVAGRPYSAMGRMVAMVATTSSVRSRPALALRVARRGYETKKLPEGLAEIRMPSIMTAKEGSLDKWLVKEGDEFSLGTQLCEVTLDDLTVSVDAPNPGFVTELLLPAGQSCKVDEPIMHIATTKEAYLAHLDARRVLEHDKELVEQAASVIEDSSKKPDVKTLLREIRHLIDTKAIDQDSGKSVAGAAHRMPAC